MIIQVAGTNGSGKSTVVQQVLASATEQLGSAVRLLGVQELVGVVGDYGQAPSGGCDGLKPDEAYHRVAAAAQKFDHVLFEGIFVMNQTRGPLLLQELGLPWTVVLLMTTMGTCLSSINQRRAVRAAGDLRNLRNVENNYKRAQNYTARMRDVGARVIRVSREAAPARILAVLCTS